MTQTATSRAALARRVEFGVIALGGLFLILGWGIGHQEWARAVGWILTGIGFAIEMVYGRVLKPSRAAEADAEPDPEPDPEPERRVTDESAP